MNDSIHQTGQVCIWQRENNRRRPLIVVCHIYAPRYITSRSQHFFAGVDQTRYRTPPWILKRHDFIQRRRVAAVAKWTWQKIP